MTRKTAFRMNAFTTTTGLAVLLLGCAPSARSSGNPRFEVAFRAVTDDGHALGGVAPRVADHLLGVTDSSGLLAVQLDGVEGQTLPLTVTCPSGFAPPDTLPPLRLAHSRLLAEQRGKPSPIAFSVVCTRQSRDVVVIVHAERGNELPILVQGKPVGTTDATGVAHILLDFSRDARAFEVRLDTSERHDLKPANPSRTFELSGRDAIVLFEQNLSVTPKLMVRKVRPERHIPDRID